MAKKKAARKKATVHGKKSDFFGHHVGSNPVFIIAVGLLIMSIIYAFVLYFGH